MYMLILTKIQRQFYSSEPWSDLEYHIQNVINQVHTNFMLSYLFSFITG